jgi:excisionase family DNA binding protein
MPAIIGGVTIYTMPEAAEVLDLAPDTVRYYVRIGELKHTKLGNTIMIKDADISAFIQSRTAPESEYVTIDTRALPKLSYIGGDAKQHILNMMQYANDPSDTVTLDDVHRITGAVLKLSKILGMEYFANITLWELRNVMTNLMAELDGQEPEDTGTGDDDTTEDEDE